VVRQVVVFTGGPRPSRSAAALVPSGALVVGVDRGAEHAFALGIQLDIVIGDLDSISESALASVEKSGARVERHPKDKDKTDLELALDLVLTFQPRRALVVGATGGRLDHSFGELLLLGSERYRAVEIDALLGKSSVHVVRSERSLVGNPGELISLLAPHGPAMGVVSHGLVYQLRGETLESGSTRGVSNVFAAREARVSVRNGVVMAVRPGLRASVV
jgi:thiamine pyrophosphokinase